MTLHQRSKSLMGFPGRLAIEGSGMSMLEVMIAMIMVVAFLGVFVTVTEFTSRWMRQSETGLPGSDGLMVDHHQLQVVMDHLAEILAQPGISQDEMISLTRKPCTFDPIADWSLPGPRLRAVPPGYLFCLRATSLAESSLQDLLAPTSASRPGIYVIQALPEQLTASTQPTRRLFCRPKPFC